MVGRVFRASVPLGFGAAIICDLFEQSVRGKYMGFYALLVTNAPHIAPIMGGYVTQDASWRWGLYIPAIAQSVPWVLTLFTFPETLYSERDGNKLEGKTYWQKFFYVGKVVDRQLQPVHFPYPFRMCKILGSFRAVHVLCYLKLIRKPSLCRHRCPNLSIYFPSHHWTNRFVHGYSLDDRMYVGRSECRLD